MGNEGRMKMCCVCLVITGVCCKGNVLQEEASVEGGDAGSRQETWTGRGRRKRVRDGERDRMRDREREKKER